MAVLKKRKVVKQTNRKTILAILRNSGEISVAELSKKVDLSKTTLMKIMNYYIGKELGSGVIMENEIKRRGGCVCRKRDLLKFFIIRVLVSSTQANLKK